MPTPFLSSEEYDERAHQLYNEGQYDEALGVLREGLALEKNFFDVFVGAEQACRVPLSDRHVAATVSAKVESLYALVGCF